MMLDFSIVSDFINIYLLCNFLKGKPPELQAERGTPVAQTRPCSLMGTNILFFCLPLVFVSFKMKSAK